MQHLRHRAYRRVAAQRAPLCREHCLLNIQEATSLVRCTLFLPGLPYRVSSPHATVFDGTLLTPSQPSYLNEKLSSSAMSAKCDENNNCELVYFLIFKDGWGYLCWLSLYCLLVLVWTQWNRWSLTMSPLRTVCTTLDTMKRKTIDDESIAYCLCTSLGTVRWKTIWRWVHYLCLCRMFNVERLLNVGCLLLICTRSSV